MDKLPNELLANIFSKLHFREKQECMLVCRLWSDVIHSTVLYDTIHFNGYTMRWLNQLLNSQPSVKLQIRDIVIHSTRTEWLIQSLFQEHFPNVKSIYIHNHHFVASGARINIPDWIFKIETLEEYDGSCVGYFILGQGKYNHIKKITLKGHFGQVLDTRFFSNAPNTTTLTLGKLTMSKNDLEAIHSSMVSLQSLELDHIKLRTQVEDRGVFFESVIPSKSLKVCLITLRHSDSNHHVGKILDILRYIRHKYVSLVHFRFITDSNQQITARNEAKIFTREMLPLIEQISSKANFLDVECTGMFLPFMDILNSNGFQERCLNLTLYLSATHVHFLQDIDQYNCIRALTLNCDSSKWMPYISENRKPLTNLTVKECKQDTIVYLDHLCDLCFNSTDSLGIEAGHVDTAADVDQTYPLRKLAIQSKFISLSAYDFIASNLPHLQHLSINFQNITCWHIPLNNLGLNRLDLHVPHMIHIVLKTENGSKKLHYRAKYQCHDGSRNTRLCCTLYPMTPGEIRLHSRKNLVIELKYLKQLYINDTVAH